MIAVLIWILLGALVFMCGGVYLALCPDEPDTNGGLEVYEDEDYFTDMLTDLAFGVDDEEAYPHELEPLPEPMVASVPDLEPLPEDDIDSTFVRNWKSELETWIAEQEQAHQAWLAEMGLDCE